MVPAVGLAAVGILAFTGTSILQLASYRAAFTPHTIPWKALPFVEVAM
jgi:hypothetical protein